METIVCSDAVAKAVALLKDGEVVALPTETVYGLAADALRPEAVVKIFEAKDRPFFDPLITHLPDRTWVDLLATVNEPLVPKLLDTYWPGPLTVLLPRKELVPDVVTSGLSEVALRMSAHPLFREVCSAFGKPLAAPSANRFGRISPTAAAHVFSELEGRIPLILDGGSTAHGVESTILRVADGRVQILRPGPISAEEISSRFGVEVLLAARVEKPSAPGQLESHYAPGTPLILVDRALDWQGTERAALLAWHAQADTSRFVAVEQLSPSGADLHEAATRLFAAMRRLDQPGIDLIVAERVPETGIGRAVMDRLRRASARW